MEARPPAENRHGGAPRGERPASWDAPRLTSAVSRVSQTRRQHKCACRRSAHPSRGGRERKERTRAQQRAAGTNNTALFDIVNTVTANGSLRAPRLRTLVSRVSLRSPRARDRRTRPPIGAHAWRRRADVRRLGMRSKTTASAPPARAGAPARRLRRTPASPRPRTAAWISAPRARRARRN
jgi:hypothetical protein